MKIIADDIGSLGETIEKAFSPIITDNGTVIFLERQAMNRSRQELPGLDDALALAPIGGPIVMLGWLSPFMNADNPRWHAALGYPNVIFRRLPEGILEITAALKEGVEQIRRPNPLAIELLGREVQNRKILILRHDLSSAEKDGGERMDRWMQRATQLLGNGTQAELIEAAKRPMEDKKVSGPFAGRSFPNVCVDIEGTLFSSDGVFQPEVLARAESISWGAPITLWTGGDLDVARKLVRDAQLSHQLISKATLRGAVVRAIVDDMEEGAFWKEYGVLYGSYHRAAL